MSDIMAQHRKSSIDHTLEFIVVEKVPEQMPVIPRSFHMMVEKIEKENAQLEEVHPPTCIRRMFSCVYDGTVLCKNTKKDTE